MTTSEYVKTPARALLEGLFNTAVAAAHPASFLPPLLPDPPPGDGRLIILAAGKAGGSMAEVAERHYLEKLGSGADRLSGIAVARHGYGRPLQHLRMVEAGHPVPDQAGVEATEAVLQLARDAGATDQVLVLLSGGASANWIAPAQGVSLADKQALTRALLRCGATIDEINTVRKHLSRIKGGRLAVLAQPASVLTLAVSDVPGDDAAVIGSGPTVPDPTTLTEARAILVRHGITPPDSIAAALDNPSNESPKPGNPAFAGATYRLAVRPADAFRAAQAAVAAADYECVFLGDRIEGEARDVAARHVALAREIRTAGRRAILLSGGELTVTIKGGGHGGPNQEYALGAALALDGIAGITVLAADTDGTDGGGGDADSPAGAVADGESAARARALGLVPAHFLAENDSTAFFAAVGGLLTPGPTYTNVNDFRAILIESA